MLSKMLQTEIQLLSMKDVGALAFGMRYVFSRFFTRC